ncbi:hypothetical protein [Mesoaciditoga lauensis]|uniref:hypothetical protein n=1 Tax=Mesoaciditoga lauensis TaxID=1495039 RepID=UPI000568B8EF|nr:hypothetical protein [Mesoaciditoga lauensis]
MLKTRNIAYGAMYAAFSVILLAISVSLADDPFTLMLASLPIAFMVDQFGVKTAIVSYSTVLVLIFAFFGLRASVIGFALLFGPYAILRGFIYKKGVLYMLIRWALLTMLGIGAYEVMNLVVQVHEDYFKLASILLLLASLFMYERLVEYAMIWHRQFFRKFSSKGR